MNQLLIFFAIVPLACFQLTKMYEVKNRWMWIGIAMGLVIAPLSYGLIQLSYIPLVGPLFGLVGLVANLTHGSIGYFCLLGSGVLEMDTVLTASQLVLINVVNGVLFSYCYGLVGYAIDRKLETAIDRKLETADSRVELTL